MLRISNHLRNSSRGLLRQHQKRLYQTQQPTTIRNNYAVIGLTASIAAASGYGIASVNMQPKSIIEKNASFSSSDVRPQVPVPAIPTHETLKQAFEELRQVLPEEHVTVDEEELQDHGYSNNSYHNEGAPNIVVYPSSTEQVSSIVRIANKYNMPIIPFSGGTSLEGHFSAPKGGICISFTEHMDQIVDFHPQDMDIVVQPGIQWENLNFFLKKEGLFFPMDPGPG
jgi:D-lactate dehydrogenase (cytochrome)